jgi:hypothetical protein
MQLSAFWTERALTPGERGLVAEVFADALPGAPVRLVATMLPTRFAVATPFDRVVFLSGRRTLPADFSTEPVPLQGWFVHEMTHLWQVRIGVPIVLAKFAALGRRAYAWSLRPGRPFLDYNIEQQAEMTATAFRLLRGQTVHPDAAALHVVFRAEAIAGRAPWVFTRSPHGSPAPQAVV